MRLEESLIDELYTIRDWIRFAATMFMEANLSFGHGTDSAWDEATQLIFQVLRFPPDGEKLALSAKLTKGERQKILKAIDLRIQKKIPVPYITQEAWLGECSFYVDERVLIPRSPIFELIENEFEPWINPEEVTDILDLCTGSGALAILCALEFPDANIDAVDISKDALAVALKNREKYFLQDQVNIIESDLFSALAGKKYQIIVSNPPYVSQEEWDSLPEEYLNEPKLALISAENGLYHTRCILKDAKNHLADDGILVVEVGNAEDALLEAYPDVPFIWPEFENDVEGVFILTKAQLEEFGHLFEKPIA